MTIKGRHALITGGSRGMPLLARSTRIACRMVLGSLAVSAPLMMVGPARAATFTVTNTNDTGSGSLRDAIVRVNFTPIFYGRHTIKFDVGFGVQTIMPSSPLPVITRPVLIDGTSQGDKPNPRLPPSCYVRRGHPCIELRGYGLTIAGGGSTVQGLAINSVDEGITSDAAITLTKHGNNVVRGNYIGTDVTGTTARPNETGVRVQSDDNRIGGTTLGDRNVIAASFQNVAITGAGNVVQGNFIGTNAAGTSALLDYGSGIGVFGSGNIVGGTARGAGNLISGNAYTGVYLGGEGGHLVQGNAIGTDVTGRLALGNKIGIFVCCSPNNVIGGPSPAARNVISGNRGDNHLDGGIYVYGDADGTRIEGNFIGTDVTGENALGNEPQGIYLLDVGGSVMIGGAAFGAGNVISGNIGPGVRIFDAVGTTTLLHGNLIGTKSNGLYPLGNIGDGVLIEHLSRNSTVGGLTDGTGNRIGFNGGAGVRVQAGLAGASTLNPILGNAIFANGGLGIDLGPDGVTPNDDGDADTGDNELQNHPVLGAASSSSGTTIIQGTLNSTPNTVFRIEFFANTICDVSGYGEAERYLGAIYSATDGSGNAGFEAILAGEVPAGHLVTATATDVRLAPGGSGLVTVVPNNTSELAACVVVTHAP